MTTQANAILILNSLGTSEYVQPKDTGKNDMSLGEIKNTVKILAGSGTKVPLEFKHKALSVFMQKNKKANEKEEFYNNWKKLDVITTKEEKEAFSKKVDDFSLIRDTSLKFIQTKTQGEKDKFEPNADYVRIFTNSIGKSEEVIIMEKNIKAQIDELSPNKILTSKFKPKPVPVPVPEPAPEPVPAPAPKVAEVPTSVGKEVVEEEVVEESVPAPVPAPAVEEGEGEELSKREKENRIGHKNTLDSLFDDIGFREAVAISGLDIEGLKNQFNEGEFTDDVELQAFVASADPRFSIDIEDAVYSYVDVVQLPSSPSVSSASPDPLEPKKDPLEPKKDPLEPKEAPKVTAVMNDEQIEIQRKFVDGLLKNSNLNENTKFELSSVLSTQTPRSASEFKEIVTKRISSTLPENERANFVNVINNVVNNMQQNNMFFGMPPSAEPFLTIEDVVAVVEEEPKNKASIEVLRTVKPKYHIWSIKVYFGTIDWNRLLDKLLVNNIFFGNPSRDELNQSINSVIAVYSDKLLLGSRKTQSDSKTEDLQIECNELLQLVKYWKRSFVQPNTKAIVNVDDLRKLYQTASKSNEPVITVEEPVVPEAVEVRPIHFNDVIF